MWPAEEKAGDRRGVRGNESCPLASQLVSLLGLHFLGRQGRGRGGGGGSRAREGPHPLSSVNLAGWSGKVGPKLPLHAGSEGLATFSPNFRGGLLVAAACSRTSLSGHVKKQLRSRWGKTGKGKRGRQRGRGGSGQGGGAALYGQDSSRKAGGESRDVIPQLYPAVTGGREDVLAVGADGIDGAVMALDLTNGREVVHIPDLDEACPAGAQ